MEDETVDPNHQKNLTTGTFITTDVWYGLFL